MGLTLQKIENFGKQRFQLGEAVFGPGTKVTTVKQEKFVLLGTFDGQILARQEIGGWRARVGILKLVTLAPDTVVSR